MPTVFVKSEVYSIRRRTTKNGLPHKITQSVFIFRFYIEYRRVNFDRTNIYYVKITQGAFASASAPKLGKAFSSLLRICRIRLRFFCGFDFFRFFGVLRVLDFLNILNILNILDILGTFRILRACGL